MSELLLALGAVVTAAGIAALGIGVSGEHDAAVGIDVITSGTIATVGGLVVLALGICVRALQRIEWAVRALTVPHQAQSSSATSTAAATAEPVEQVRIPLSAKPAVEPSAQPAAFAAPAAALLGEAAGSETFREKFPALVKLDNGPVTQDVDLPLSPKSAVRAEADDGKSGPGHLPGSANGATPIRVAVRPDGNPRRATSSERGKISTFDSLWPKAGQLKRHVQGGSAQAAAIAAVEPAQASAPEPALQTKAATPVQAPSVSILKSGVVDGMAYTLYSDGSIEAQLPNGTLRFGSITELRNHIERGS